MQYGAGSTPLPHPSLRTRPPHSFALAQWITIGPMRAGPVRAGVAVLYVHGRSDGYRLVFLTVALTLNRVPSVGWCPTVSYGLRAKLVTAAQSADHVGF